MGENPAHFPGKSRPVEQVSWNDCQEFLKKLNTLSDRNYYLPTEAQWEFAARGGIYRAKEKDRIFAGSTLRDEVAWWDENSHYGSMKVGEKRPNALGLYDMSGNVWEWCQDWYDESYYQECLDKGTLSNPRGPREGTSRVVRGGSWFNVTLTTSFSAWPIAYFSQPTYVNYDIGFRLCGY